MAGITLTQAQAHLDEWLAADLAVSKGQAYSIGGPVPIEGGRGYHSLKHRVLGQAG